MRNRVIMGCLLGGALLGLQAGTVFVDVNYGPGGDGSTNAPYNTIQAALDNPEADTVVVYPGTYKEYLFTRGSVHILGYDGPHTTIIDASDDVGRDAVYVYAATPDQHVWIEGLWMTGGRTALTYAATTGADATTTFAVNNCIFTGASGSGLNLIRYSATAVPRVRIQNCVIAGNGLHGLALNGESQHNDRAYPVIVRNTIIYANLGFGAWDKGVQTGGYSFSITSQYNDVFDNAQGDYSGVGVGSFCVSTPPLFVDAMKGMVMKDFRLRASSVNCRDKGDPGLGSLDPDGSRNDMGAFGGPGARHFPDGVGKGPIVRELSVSKGVVPKGETVTIRAKAAVR